MKKKIIIPFGIVFLTLLLGLIGFSSCKKHKPVTKYGPPPLERVDAESGTDINIQNI